SQEVDVQSACQIHAANEQKIGPYGKIFGQLMFCSDSCLLAVGSIHARAGTKDGRRYPRCWRNQRPPMGRRKKICRRAAVRHLLESLGAIHLDSLRQIAADIALEKYSVPRAQHPPGRWFPCEADARAEIMRGLVEFVCEPLEIIPDPKTSRYLRCERIVVLNETAKAGHRKVLDWITELLAELAGLPGEEILE